MSSRKKPLSRALHGPLSDASSAKRGSYELTILDTGHGPPYTAEANVQLPNGQTVRGAGQISGEDDFLSAFLGSNDSGPTSRGRPAKTERDVAVFLAFRWFWGLAFAEGVVEKRARSRKAKDGVLQLWADRGFDGLGYESHLNARLRSSKAALRDQFGSRCVAWPFRHGVSGDAMVVAVAESSVRHTEDGILVSGNGWIWTYGEEQAVFSPVRARLLSPSTT